MDRCDSAQKLCQINIAIITLIRNQKSLEYRIEHKTMRSSLERTSSFAIEPLVGEIFS